GGVVGDWVRRGRWWGDRLWGDRRRSRRFGSRRPWIGHPRGTPRQVRGGEGVEGAPGARAAAATRRDGRRVGVASGAAPAPARRGRGRVGRLTRRGFRRRHAAAL